ATGRDRHALGVHDRRADAGGRYRDGARPRLARAGAASDRRHPRLARRGARAGVEDAEGRLATAFHDALGRRVEPDLPVEPVRVARVQDPPDAGVRAVLDRLAYQPHAEPPAAVLREDVDVGEVDE